MSQHPSETEKREKIAELINGIGTAMMTTVAPDGTLHARPMATAEFKAPHRELWFATDKTTAKTAEIMHDRRVALAYARPGANEWVAISGQASLIDSRPKIHELWSPLWKAWFTGQDDPRLVLIRVEPSHAEYWDSGASRIAVLFQAVRGAITGKPGAPDEPGGNEKVSL